MNTREEMQINYEEQLLFADGFDECIIGVSDDFGKMRVVYSIDKMVEKWMLEHGESYLNAREYLEFNTFCAWVGENTPIYVESECAAMADSTYKKLWGNKDDEV